MNIIKSTIYTALSVGCLLAPQSVFAEPTHGISMTGTLDLAPDFANLPYVNPDAEPGGRIVYAENGSFDSFSPFIVAGKTPYGFKVHVYESFLKRSIDESFSLYGLLAEKVDMAEDRTSVEFFLNPNAKFSNGDPVTIDDAIWSYEILAEKGLSKYARYMSGVTKIEKTSENSVKFELTGENRELPLLLGIMPIMRQADFEGVEFDEGMTEPTIGSGPYFVADYKMGDYITFERDPNYWGKDLPINKGQNNLDEIKYVYFADADVIFEAFKAGDVNIFVEGDPKRWESYDFERFNNGEIAKTGITHSRPTGMQGFFFNTRREPLDDWRVREALITGMNFPFINQTINEGAYPRITSFFANSYLESSSGPAEGKVRELIEPFADQLPPEALDGYELPAGNVSGRDREGIQNALALLQEAGFSVQDGEMKNDSGEPFVVSALVRSGAEEEQIANLWADGLKPLGITLNIDSVDGPTFEDRKKAFDYDIIYSFISVSLSPGAEQYARFSAEAADTEGSRNIMRTKNPALPAMVDAMLNATSLEDYVAATKALDRMIMAERYFAPTWYTPEWRILHDARLKFPETVPKFGYWPGYAPDSMYWEE